ncbi:MAG: exodeoxyribonuclease III [Bradyrhizobium sp.]|nr:MAG: exodeoxyribonuclease III [Bradyrhizobium sp.]
MALTIATWNINSVRLRAGLVADFLAAEAPDILCLQETKSPVEKIPFEVFAEIGYGHWVARGQKGYNGVAILSRLPLEDAGHGDWCAKGDARHVAARLPGGVVLHNFYIPAGGDEPDPETNPKFAHKLQFLDEVTAWGTGQDGPAILVGDLNIAPLEEDVWSHRQLLKVVSHTPVETEKLKAALEAGEWVDVARDRIPMSEKVYTWWSYRSADWTVGDRGRRLDHIWVSRALKDAVSDFRILRDARSWERPSDHVPVTVTLEV